jgi:hypothetical protein
MIFEYIINDNYYYYYSIIKSFKFYKILVTPIENTYWTAILYNCTTHRNITVTDNARNIDRTNEYLVAATNIVIMF